MCIPKNYTAKCNTLNAMQAHSKPNHQQLNIGIPKWIYCKPKYTQQVSIQHQTAFINVWFLCSQHLTLQNVIYLSHIVSYLVSVGQILIIIDMKSQLITTIQSACYSIWGVPTPYYILYVQKTHTRTYILKSYFNIVCDWPPWEEYQTTQPVTSTRPAPYFSRGPALSAYDPPCISPGTVTSGWCTMLLHPTRPSTATNKGSFFPLALPWLLWHTWPQWGEWILC